MSDGAKDARYGAANVTAGSGWDEGSHAGSATPCSANPKVRAFVRSIREQCAGISTCDPPKHWLADSLRAQWARARGEIDVLTLTPADDELVVREILKGTNT